MGDLPRFCNYTQRCIGSSLLTERDNSKKAEGVIIGNIINLWNSFGQCESVKIG